MKTDDLQLPFYLLNPHLLVNTILLRIKRKTAISLPKEKIQVSLDLLSRLIFMLLSE